MAFSYFMYWDTALQLLLHVWCTFRIGNIVMFCCCFFKSFCWCSYLAVTIGDRPKYESDPYDRALVMHRVNTFFKL